jgi:hypothetical protein
VTFARSVARLTLASWTPSTLAKAFSMRRTQLAQVIPVTGKVICFVVIGFLLVDRIIRSHDCRDNRHMA